MFHIITCILFLVPFLCSSQTLIKGKVMAVDQTYLPYVNLGLEGTSIGTVSKADGSFYLSIPDSIKLNDNFKFSLLGYKDQTVSLSYLLDTNTVITLEETIMDLPTIMVVSTFSEFSWIGQNKTDTKRAVNFAITGKNNGNLGSAIGRKFSIKKPTELVAFRFFLSGNDFSSANFRINIHTITDGMPGPVLHSQPIISSVQYKKRGWIEVDLSSHSIKVDNDIIISVEWIDYEGEGRSLKLPIRLPSFSTHYYKFGSQNDWNKFKGMSTAMELKITH